MKLVLFSDLHVRNHKFGASIDAATGRNSRLQDCLSVLDITAEAAMRIGASARLFVGDMFDERGKIRPSIFNPVFDHYSTLDHGFQDFIVVGNHDMEHRVDGQSSVHGLLSSRTSILSGYGFEYRHLHGDETLAIAHVSYDPDVASLRRKVDDLAKASYDTPRSAAETRIMLIHHGVDGVIEGIPDAGFNPSHLPVDDFDFIFCGDYHTHKEIIPGKAWMIGAPLQHNFGDAGQKRGYMTVDTETRKVEFVEITSVPQFCTWDVIGGKAELVTASDKIAGNFFRVRSDDESGLKKIEAELVSAGALAVRCEPVREGGVAKRITESLSMKTSDLFKTWLVSQSVDEGRQKAVLVLNEEILAEAGVV